MPDFNFGEQPNTPTDPQPDGVNNSLKYPLDPYSMGVLRDTIRDILFEVSRVQSITLTGVESEFDVRNTDVMNISADSATSISIIRNGYSGQILTLYFNDANTTIVDDSTGAPNTINLGGANFTSVAGTTLQLIFNGTSWALNKMGLLSAIAGTISGTLNVTGALVMGTGGLIREGQTDYDTGVGFWLGDKSGTAKFSLGDSAGNKITWDGVSLTITGVQKVLSSFTAAENLTAGNPVGISNTVDGNVSRAVRTVSSVAHGISNSAFTGLNNSIGTAIGGDKFVWLTYDSATADILSAQVGSIDRATMTMTLGTAVTVSTDVSPVSVNLENVAVCKLDTDKFVVFYINDASTTVIKYRVGTVSGTTISFGSETTFVTAGSTVLTSAAWGADFISTDKGIMFFKAATTTNSKMFAFTASGTTLTVGTGVTPGTQSRINTASYIKTIGTDKYVLVTNDTATTLEAQVCTLSGTTITAGTEAQISTVVSTVTLGNLQVVSPATDVFVVRARGNSANVISVVAATVSGTTISAGTPVSTTSVTNSAINSGGIYASSATSLFITGEATPAIQKMTLSGNALTLVGIIAQQFTALAPELTITMDNGYFITVNVSATTLDAWIQGMANGFIGIAQSTVARGATVNVVVNGIDSNQSGLNAGSSYLVSNGALTFLADNTTINTLDDLNVVKATSSTQIIF